MAEDLNWNQTVLSLLVKTTRELKFDWNAVAKKLSQDVPGMTFTAVNCRQQYAKEYSKNTKEEPTPIASNTVSVETTSSSSTKVEWKSYDDLSLEELIEHVNKKEAEMNTRKEEIFQRVLNSLGGSEQQSNLPSTPLNDEFNREIEEVKRKYFDSVQQKEIEKLNKQQLAYDQQEKINLENERLKLKKRFDTDSVDNIGENPLADTLDTINSSSGSSNATITTASALSVQDSAALSQLLGNSVLSAGANDKKLFNSLINPSVVGKPGSNTEEEVPLDLPTDLEGILMNDQFDIILSEIEKELDSLSQDKIEGKLLFQC